MKRLSLFFIIALFVLLPLKVTEAQEYELKAGKEIKGAYAGPEEESYNYFKLKANKNGYIEIKIKTSNKKNLNFDICDINKNPIATNVNLVNSGKVMHKVKKGQVYYIRTKGEENQTHSISYKEATIKTLSYAKKYTYTFTNASMTNNKNCVSFEIKNREHGIISLMQNSSNNICVQFANKKGKAQTDMFLVNGNNLTGLAGSSNTVYKAYIWNPTNTNEGTTTIKNLKYQVRHLSTSKYPTRGNAKELSKGKKSEKMIIAGKKTTDWYEIDLDKEQKIKLSLESRLFNNKGLKVYICNEKGKALHKKPIVITEELNVKFKKKYKMVYPIKEITTGKLPKGKYFIKVISNNKKTTGSYTVSWK